MKVAILSKTVCPPSRNVVNYFLGRGYPVSLIVVEKSFRKKFSKTEKLFQQAHDQFNRKTKKYGLLRRIARKIWDFIPIPIRKFVFVNIYQLPFLNKFSVRKFCETNSIPVFEVQKHSSDETKEIFEKNDIDYVLYVSSNWLLKKPIINMEKTRIINAHSGWLPKHKGLDSIGWSIMENDPIGLTTHFIDEGVDSGDILKFFPIELEKHDTLNSISKKIGNLQPIAFRETLKEIEKGTIIPINQTKAFNPHRPMSLDELMKVEEFLKSSVKNDFR